MADDVEGSNSSAADETQNGELLAPNPAVWSIPATDSSVILCNTCGNPTREATGGKCMSCLPGN